MTKPLILPRSQRRANSRRPLQRASARRLIAELNALQEIGRAISREWHLSEVLEKIYEQTSRLMDTRDFYIALYDAEKNLIEFPLALAAGARVKWPPRRWQSGLTEWLLEHRRPLRLNASDLTASLSPIILGTASQSFLGVPIVLGDQALGVLSVQSTEQYGAYSARDQHILTMIADQAAVAIANAQRYEAVDLQLQQRVKQLEALEETARDLNATLDLDTILDRLIARVCSTTGADAGMVCLLSENRDTMLIKAMMGYPEELAYYQQHGWSIQRGLAGQVIRTGEADWTPDVRLSPNYSGSRATTLSQMTVPIRHSGAVLGVMVIESDQPGAFSKDLTGFVSQIADHAALSMQNAHIYQQVVAQRALLAQRSHQLGQVLRISQALSANLNLDVLLPEIVQSIRTSLGFNIALLNLVDSENPAMMRRRAAVGIPEAQWSTLRQQPVPVAWFKTVMREEFRISHSYYIPHSHAEHTLIWSDTQANTYRPDLGERAADEWHSDDALFVPLFDSDGRLISVLSVDDPSDRQTPSLDSVQVLEIFATQAAIAIENANLYTATHTLAITDGLTGLFNQGHFMSLLEREVLAALRYGYPLSLLAIDLDLFKGYNDTYGHPAGNILLREFAQVLRTGVREVDLVGRIGGEEFAIILPKTDESGALQLAERLRVATETHAFSHQRVTVSIGVASLQPLMEATALHNLADQALYAAKRHGRNAVIAAPTATELFT